MEPTEGQRSKMETINDLCEWYQLSPETPDGEGMVSPRLAFLKMLEVEGTDHWGLVGQIKEEKLARVSFPLQPPAVAHGGESAIGHMHSHPDGHSRRSLRPAA